MKHIRLFILLLIVTSCTPFEASIEQIPAEKTNGPLVFFCPRDDCENALIELIDYAKKYIHCAFYDIDLTYLIQNLSAKSHNIDVKIVVDNDNYGAIKGDGVRKDTSSQYSHNKFCIIDDFIVTTGSFNPTERGNFYNNNNLVVFYSYYLARNYEDEFQELWNGTFGNGKNVRYPKIKLNDFYVENYFCPEDHCSEHIIHELNKANKSIYFMTFSFTHEEIADALLFKDKNFDIKGIFEKRNAGTNSQFERLKGFGLDIRKDGNSYNMHHKVLIIDNETVITGSFNPSINADKKNDENILIIHNKEIANKFLEEFDYVWNEAEE